MIVFIYGTIYSTFCHLGIQPNGNPHPQKAPWVGSIPKIFIIYMCV